MSKSVCLYMYDFPECRESTLRWFEAIKAELIRTRSADNVDIVLNNQDSMLDQIERNDLMIGQTCGYPLILNPNSFRVVGIPKYSVKGCQGHFYRSAIIVKGNSENHNLNDFRDKEFTMAVNSQCSLSGNLFLRATLGRDLLNQCSDNIIYTGAHEASIVAVSEGRADIAAIDCVTYALLLKFKPDLVKTVRVIGYTEKAPALPYVSSFSATDAEVSVLREALVRAVENCPRDALDELYLTGFHTDESTLVVAGLSNSENIASSSASENGSDSATKTGDKSEEVSSVSDTNTPTFVKLYESYIGHLKYLSERPSSYKLFTGDD